MLIEQIHFPANGTNWNKIIVGSIILISVCTIVYVVSKPKNVSKFSPKSKSKEDNVA